MAISTTAKFEELTLEISTDGGSTWDTIAGLVDIEITRTSNVDTNEIPDADDESLPLTVEKAVRSLDVSVSGTGVWAQESHGDMMDWYYSGASLDCRLWNQKAASGTPEYETGEALLTNLSNSRTKGQKVTATFELQFDGAPTVTNKA